MTEPVTIEVAAVQGVLQRLTEFAEDLTPVMRPIAGMLAFETRDNFRKQASPLGVPWLQSQRAREQGGLTLVDSGDLFGSIREAWGPDFASAGPEASGGAAVYAAVHQWGARIVAKVKKALNTPFGPRGAVTIPARPYVGWNPTMIADAYETIANAVARIGRGEAPA